MRDRTRATERVNRRRCTERGTPPLGDVCLDEGEDEEGDVVVSAGFGLFLVTGLSILKQRIIIRIEEYKEVKISSGGAKVNLEGEGLSREGGPREVGYHKTKRIMGERRRKR